MAQMVKNTPAKQETRLDLWWWEDHLEKGMVTYSRILAWRILWIEEAGEPQSMGLQRVRMIEQLTLSLSYKMNKTYIRTSYWFCVSGEP